VIGNPAHDLVRLGLSLGSAARGSNLPGYATARMLQEMLAGYESMFATQLAVPTSEMRMPDLAKKVMHSALQRKWRDLANERIEDTSPSIPRGDRFWALSKQERDDIQKFFEGDDARKLMTGLYSRDEGDPVELVDAAFWVKGCSSLGCLRYAALLRVGGKEGKLCLFDLKEARRPLAPFTPGAHMPPNNAQRGVTGARHLSPARGERMLAGKVLGREVFVRELLPQDLKLEVDGFSLQEAVHLARYLSTVVGCAHARQMDQPTRGAWLKELHRARSKNSAAPSWLWSSVVDLMVNHEGAYLEHCRRFASKAAD